MSDETETGPRTGRRAGCACCWWCRSRSICLSWGPRPGLRSKADRRCAAVPPGGMGAMHRALSEEERSDLKKQMIRNFRGRKDEREAFRQEMTGLVTLLRAEEFDAGAAADGMARVRALFDDRVAAAQTLLIAYWGEMSPADRVAYADRLEQELQRRRR